MNPTDDTAAIDHERAGITARSTMANIDVLSEEGLTSDDAERVRAHAGALNSGSLGARGAAEHAKALRVLLAELSGPTSRVLVAWLDNALGDGD